MESGIAINMDDTPRRAPTQTRSRRTRRVKTFSGCMTCRSRHVKCDEARPACRRCVNARIECSGYSGYRAAVQWKPVRVPSDFRTARAAASETSDGTAHQRFADPRPSSSTASSPLPHRPSSLQPDSPLAAEPSQPDSDASQHDNTSLIHHTLPSLFPPPWQAQDAPAPVHHAREGEGLRSNSSCSAPQLVPQPTWFGFNQSCYTAECHIDLLSSMHLQRRCIEHWVNHLSDALSSVPGSKSPLKRVLVPIAYAGATSPAASSTGSVALFYLICSAAAFHLSAHLKDEKEKSDFMTVALSHHNQGIHHLQHNLVKDDPDQRESVLASLLMCLTFEPATVERDFWLTHLRGASQWLHRVDITSWAHSESTIVMYQMLASTATMLRSQVLSEEIAQDANFHFEMKVMLEPYYLDHIFGVPKRCLEIVSGMISMAVSLNQDSPRLSVDLDRLEMELYLSVPQDCQVPAATQGQNDLVHHYLHIFYFGSIIYCKRRLKGSPLSEVQTLVEQAFEHIEALANYTSRPYSPILWPIAIAFFEAQDVRLRRRTLVWLDFIIQKSTLSIWQKVKPLICSLWEKREIPGQEEIQWDAFLSDPSTPSIMIV
ncbi:hypothetical protein CEP54_002555 [Fusarium duplospermum]|uniref:Zn(2)-C6 fungal-type domain-containing protein n=1 Tax=Fusarium duplospermum TaxID=1325734 RepID=A0A428QV06_9HYPO|nr:hypothetical protein CEP54_002555 [Fusarium duplospermum]